MNPKDKTGWQTTEFWMCLAAVVVTYLQSSELGDESTWWGKAIGIVVTVLAVLGYTASRAVVKRARIQNGKR